ncbi:hypothetical protein REPUB_Repub12eG0101200 [Reevesia pubescens]
MKSKEEDEKYLRTWSSLGFGLNNSWTQVIPSPAALDTQTSSAATAHQTAFESAELNNNQSPGAVHANVESYNRWGPAVGRTHSELSNTVTRDGWMGQKEKTTMAGLCMILGQLVSNVIMSKPLGIIVDGRMDQQKKPMTGLRLTLGQLVNKVIISKPLGITVDGWMHQRKKTMTGLCLILGQLVNKVIMSKTSWILRFLPLVQKSGFHASMSSAPSAPPIPEDVLGEEPIHYPLIDLNPVEFSVPATTDYRASTTNDAKEEGGSSSCIICWEAPVEGACIPCGHMAGCMSCLNVIKAKKGLCRVFRGKPDQVISVHTV